MLVFKRVDCVIQIITIAAGLVMAFAAREVLNETFFAAYFLVGGWQLFSVIVHFFFQAPYKTQKRKIYLISLGVVLLALLLCLPSDSIIAGLAVLLVVSPFMAIFYLATCIEETKQLTLITQPLKAGEPNS
jgi:hypothetical protein